MKKYIYILLLLFACNEILNAQEKGGQFALKTNILYDLAPVPNIGLEYHFGKGWSTSADWNCAWWNNKKKDGYWRIYGGQLEVRKYLGELHKTRALSGHHIGIYGQGFTYDFLLVKKGQLSNFSYGAGFSYGFSAPLSPAFNLDFCVGIGYVGGDYKVYEKDNGCYVWQETRVRNYFGPSKVEITLIWLIGQKKRGESR